MDLNKKQKYANFGLKGLNKRFKLAALSGDLQNIQYFLLIEKLDIHFDNDFVFRIACKKGYLHILQYILTSEALTEHANIHVSNDIGFRKACMFGHLEVVKYLTTSNELTDHANVYAHNNEGLQMAQQNNNKELEKFLLFFKLDQLLIHNPSTPRIKI